MLKIAHMADLHFRGLSRHAEYRNSFNDAFRKLEKLKPDVILVAGDIVHSKTQGISPELINILTWWVRSLGNIAPTHITLGNHDGLLMNADRDDAISPIVKAVGHPRVFLHKKSGTVKLADGYNLCVFSCFDKLGWKDVTPVQDEVNIATFHGSVAGSKTDDDWKMEGEVSVDFFKRFDVTMLGDIHKRQFLDSEKRVGFSGSLIQQNYGEEREKGFLFWAIEDRDNFASRFVPVVNNSPFVTLQYSGNIDDMLDAAEGEPERSRFRVCVDDSINNGEISQIKGALKRNFKPTEIVFKHQLSQQLSNVVGLSSPVDTFDDINALVTEFYAGQQVGNKVREVMATYLRSAWDSAKIDDSFSGGKFHIRKMEFDNTFGYGEGNVINFDNAYGLTGVFGKNRSGKSSICGTLAYGLYNGTDRGPMKNLHIINARKDHCLVKIYFTKSGVDYLLERQTVRVTNKNGFSWAPTELNLFETDPVTGDKKDKSEEQRRETEKVLRDLVGNLDDFLLTSLSSQGNVNKFIDLNAAARKSYLSRFLKLDIFEKLHSSLRDELNVTKRMLESVAEKEFDSLITEIDNKMKARTKRRDDNTVKLEELKVSLEKITSVLANQQENSYTLSEVAEQESVVAAMSSRVSTLANEFVTLNTKRIGLEENRKQFLVQVTAGDVKSLVKRKGERDGISRDIEKSTGVLEKKKEEIGRDKQQVKNLSDVPCGDTFPTCKYIVSAKDARTTLEKKLEEFKELKHAVSTLQCSYDSLLKESIDEKLQSLDSTAQKAQALLLEVSELDIRRSKLEHLTENTRALLTTENNKLDTMRTKVCDESVHDERERLVGKKRELEQEFKALQAEISTLSEQIGTNTAQLSQTKREKEEFESRSQKNHALKLLTKSLSKDGIPLGIVRKRLPIINAELSNILQISAGFTVELESDEESNDMEIYINYGDSKRIIECGSGMEKMMSSIAIRAALTNVSSLPRSDIFIVDEGFGALDGKNLEACSALLRGLTKYFKSIIIISHVDGIKDMVDNVIEIDNRGIDASVCFD